MKPNASPRYGLPSNGLPANKLDTKEPRNRTNADYYYETNPEITRFDCLTVVKNNEENGG